MKNFIVTVLLMFAVWTFWAMLELSFYGEIQTRKVDDYIGFIFAVSIYGNVKSFMKEVNRNDTAENNKHIKKADDEKV